MDKNLLLAVLMRNNEYFENSLKELNEEEVKEYLLSQTKEIKKFLMDGLSCEEVNVYTRKVLLPFLKEYEKVGKKIGLVYVDQNNLAMINKNCKDKEKAGDLALRYMCTAINMAIGESESEATIVRTGGDEFVILMTDESQNGESFEEYSEKIMYKAKELCNEFAKSDVFDGCRSIIDGCVINFESAGISYTDIYESKETNEAIEKNIRNTEQNQESAVSRENVALKIAIDKADFKCTEKKNPFKNLKAKENTIYEFIDTYLMNSHYVRNTTFSGEIKRGITENELQISSGQNELINLLAITPQENIDYEIEKFVNEKGIEELKKLLYCAAEEYLSDGTQILSRNSINLINSLVNEKNYKCFLFSVDNLKIINKAYGHHGGDIFLNDVKSLVSQAVTPPDFVVSCGGGEFAGFVDADRIDDVKQKIIEICEDINNKINEDAPENPKIILSNFHDVEKDNDRTFIPEDKNLFEYINSTKSELVKEDKERNLTNFRFVNVRNEDKTLYLSSQEWRGFVSFDDVEKCIDEYVEKFVENIEDSEIKDKNSEEMKKGLVVALESLYGECSNDSLGEELDD